MLVFHHDTFNTCEWAADYDHGIAGYKFWHLGLADDDIFVAGFDDDAETLHLPVGDGEKIVGAVGVDGKMIVIRCHSGE